MVCEDGRSPGSPRAFKQWGFCIGFHDWLLSRNGDRERQPWSLVVLPVGTHHCLPTRLRMNVCLALEFMYEIIGAAILAAGASILCRYFSR